MKFPGVSGVRLGLKNTRLGPSDLKDSIGFLAPPVKGFGYEVPASTAATPTQLWAALCPRAEHERPNPFQLAREVERQQKPIAAQRQLTA